MPDKHYAERTGGQVTEQQSVDTIQRLRAELSVEGHALRAAATFLAGAATESFFLDIPEAARTYLRERLEQAQAAIDAAISPNCRRMLIKQEFEIAHWKKKADEAESLHRRLSAIAAKLEEAVCTEGCDKGVVLLSDHGTTHREVVDGSVANVYDHEYFSPLGDALIAAWELARNDAPISEAVTRAVNGYDPLLSTCRAVLHQLVHGEAGEGDERDIRWCIRTLSEAVAVRDGVTNA